MVPKLTDEDRKFGDWLLSDAPQEDKLARCWAIIERAKSERVHLELLGKATCHVVYRLLDGCHDRQKDCEDALHLARDAAYRGEGEDQVIRTRWLNSLNMACVYLRALIQCDTCAAMSGCLEMATSAAEWIDAHPPNVVNVCRSQILLAVHCIANCDRENYDRAIACARRSFKQAVVAADFTRAHPGLADELAWAATMVKASMLLPNLSGIEKLESHAYFSRALKAMCKPSREWEEIEQARYNAVYLKGYGAAQPMDIVTFCKIEPTARLLDLGCGGATLADVFENYTGIDVSDVIIEQNRRTKKGAFECSSFYRLSVLLGQAYDAAVCSDVMEHIPPDKVDDCLKEIASLKIPLVGFNICCRDSAARGPFSETLHPTNKPPLWWIEKLRQFFIVTRYEETGARVLVECRPL